MRLFVTKRAEQNYDKIKGYIENKFGERVANVFEQKAIDFFELLINYPEMGSIEVPNRNIRAFQLAKQTKVIYRIKGEKIIILNFFDVRQNPERKFK